MNRTIVAAAFATLLALPLYADDLADVRREGVKRHDEAVKRLQDWIALPSIAAENLNSPMGNRASSPRSMPARRRRSGSTSCTT